MKLESRATEILTGRVRRAFDPAVDDTLDVARAIAAREAETGKFERSLERTPELDTGGMLTARIGSPLASARPHEAGAFIQAKDAPWLVFSAGGHVRKVKSVRIKPHPVVTPAGRQFGKLMTARLREQRGTS